MIFWYSFCERHWIWALISILLVLGLDRSAVLRAVWCHFLDVRYIGLPWWIRHAEKRHIWQHGFGLRLDGAFLLVETWMENWALNRMWGVHLLVWSEDKNVVNIDSNVWCREVLRHKIKSLSSRLRKWDLLKSRRKSCLWYKLTQRCNTEKILVDIVELCLIFHINTSCLLYEI